MISPQHLFRESKIENISAYEILKTSSSVNSNFLFKAILWSALRLLPVQNITSESLKFLASQDALEVMWISQSVSQSVSQSETWLLLFQWEKLSCEKNYPGRKSYPVKKNYLVRENSSREKKISTENKLSRDESWRSENSWRSEKEWWLVTFCLWPCFLSG